MRPRLPGAHIRHALREVGSAVASGAGGILLLSIMLEEDPNPRVLFRCLTTYWVTVNSQGFLHSSL